MRPWLLLGLLVNALIWGYLGYNWWPQRPPPTIPCEDGMTLLPGQTCVGIIVIAPGRGHPENELKL